MIFLDISTCCLALFKFIGKPDHPLGEGDLYPFILKGLFYLIEELPLQFIPLRNRCPDPDDDVHRIVSQVVYKDMGRWFLKGKGVFLDKLFARTDPSAKGNVSKFKTAAARRSLIARLKEIARINTVAINKISGHL